MSQQQQQQQQHELTLERLQEILKEQKQSLEEEEQKNGERRGPFDALWQSDHTIFRHHTSIHNLYRSPISAPSTTLAIRELLPRPLQESLLLPQQQQQNTHLVEVPIHAQTQTTLTGNLSDKLSEYTRGVAGQRKSSFHPTEEGSKESTTTQETENPSYTPECVARHQRVLSQPIQHSYREGILLTAPPGLPFHVGLSYEDVYGPLPLNDTMDHHDAPTAVANQQRSATPNRMELASSEPKPLTLFSKAYFDDDSLFASSSSESDSDNDTDDDEDEQSKTDAQQKDGTKMDTLDGVELNPDLQAATMDEQDNVQELDELLQNLTITDRMIPKKKTTAQHNVFSKTPTVYGKTWATTKLLPIVDFFTTVPNPALSFPFTLDDFQQQAVCRLERSEHVFVAAHTSAGKTVVAEYAIAMAQRHNTRAVYTSPIKALSNQKFRDFCIKFGNRNVGLITGDMQVNADEATCLIMTTEILRSMLYRGADLIRDVEYVIFDEVHYVNDTERGVVYEETIIMLPKTVNLIFLSATTPNTLEFSDWIGRTKQKPVHVVKTNYRPVPLSHFLWAGTKLHKVLEGRGGFLEKGYRNAATALQPASAGDKDSRKKKKLGRPASGAKDMAWQQQGSKGNWVSLVRFLDRELLTPAVIFSFSKKKCEEIARMLGSIDLNTAKERSSVQGFVLQTVARLSQNDAKLPQVLTICEMVQRGIGVHHGGLLPILKEMVEILFSRNLIKVLLATETFAMGVNMPAKAVVFNSIRKHDGSQFRVLEPGEYTQMAGRAGRRSLDKVGTVILCCFGEVPPPQKMLQHMMTGQSTRLSSQFRLTYNMILLLLRTGSDLSVESMIKRSFSEFATQRALTANDYPELLAKGTRALEKLEADFVANEPNRIGIDDLEDYYGVCNELMSNHKQVSEYIQETDGPTFDDLYQPGRVVFIMEARSRLIRAPVIILRGPTTPSDKTILSKTANLVCLSLLPASFIPDESHDNEAAGTIGSVGSACRRHYKILETEIGNVLFVADGKKRKIDVKLLLKEDKKAAPDFANRAADPFAGMMALGSKGATKIDSSTATEAQMVDEVVECLVEAERLERGDGNPTIDLSNLVRRGSDLVKFRNYSDEILSLVVKLRSFTAHRHPNLEQHYQTVERKETLRFKVETLQHLLSNQSLQLFPDFLTRKQVLKKLGYLVDDTVSTKGMVACEVNTCSELIATEIVFEGILNPMSPEEIVAVLSSLVCQEKKIEEFDSELPEKIVSVCEKLQLIATNLGQIQKEAGLDVDPGDFCDQNLNFALTHVVYEWALGVPFKNICELTDIQEGSIVRTITRLDELCREIRNCARVVGNPTLYRKLEAASVCIKRDIVFASSLYVS